MGFAQLKKTIIDKAQKEADVIIKSAYKEAEDAKRKLELEMENLESRSKEEVQALTEMMENREIASASLEAKKAQLIAKKELIDQVFREAEEKLDKKLTSAQRRSIITNLLKKADSEIKVGKIYCNKKDLGHAGSRKKEEADILGGIIAEDKSGEVQVDYCFETLLSDIKDKNSAEITRILFE